MVNSYDIAILSEKVARLEALLAGGGVALPEVTSEDNGATLQVIEGAWAKGLKLPELPSVTASDEGSVLQVNSSGAWVKGVDLKPVTEELATGITIKRYGNVRELIISSVAGAATIATLPVGDRPSVAFATIGRWVDTNNLFKPCTVSTLTDGAVTASYIDANGSAGLITDGTVVVSMTYLI